MTTTMTTTIQQDSSPMHNPSSPPQQCPINISSYPKLDRLQAGHLRHYHNLTSQPDGSWNHFGTTEGQSQEFDDAARYQLATMTYAAGAAHYHRLPALRGPFKQLFRQMIHKMLLKDVWGYWYLASQSGNLFDPDLKELRRPWADPVKRENIMYSGHLFLMTSLWGMLFDDDTFEKTGPGEEGLVFKWEPLFWGLGKDGGREVFKYSNRGLQEVILEQMEANGWVGVCCEPNAVFVVCNQFPIIAMRYNDVRDGTDKVSVVLEKYKKALEQKGMVGKDGLYASFYAVKQQLPIPARQGAHTAWANTFMNSWNSEVVRSLYDQQTLGFLTNFNGRTELHPTRVANAFRKIVLEEGGDPSSLETLKKARERSKDFENPRIPFETLSWLGFTMMLSELGKKKELNDLLDYADKRLNGTWEKGGYFYPRNDRLVDDDWNLVHIEPHSGNSGVGYARLNVEDGQKKMWEKPWTREVLASRPWVDGVGFADDVDFMRGIWDEKEQAMVVTLKRWCGEARGLKMQIRNLASGRWATYVNGKLRQTALLEATGDVDIDEMVGQEEVDLVVVRVGEVSKL